MTRMAQLIACGRVAPEKLITHHYHGMDKIPEALRLFLNHDRSLSSLLNPYDRIKALITRYHEKQAENGFRLV